MDTTPLKLPIHIHPLFPLARVLDAICGGCDVYEYNYGGYYCNEPYCSARYHKECAEAPLEINHLSHPQHSLILFTQHSSFDLPCDLCGQGLPPCCYCCPTCEFKVDLVCGMKPSPLAIEHPPCHDHPLVFLKTQYEFVLRCGVCKESFYGRPSYSCLECCVYFHVDCVHLSKELSHPCHSTHPLKLMASDSLTDDADKSCLICEQEESVFYQCSICNFTACLDCTKKPPPLVYELTKTHKHPLTLFSKRISYTCDACGEEGKTSPYICLQCDFVIHRGCIDLPRVININRHDHRISFTLHLGAGYSKCGVCRQYISQYKGAYSCYVCPNYAVHTRCALGGWDRIELVGIPDDTEDIAPFKVVGDDLICYFSHEEHPLKLHNEDIIHNKYKQCEACSHQVGFGSIYVCEECCFFLHEKCANLPMKKRVVFDIVPYTLKVVRKIVDCRFCKIYSHGFTYTSHNGSIDVHCGSLSEPFIHDGHLHPLYFGKTERLTCDGCQRQVDYCLRCDDCDFYLCFVCTSLPKKTWCRNDEHPLTLCFGEKANNKYWCDVCERDLDPSEWFYTCSDCGVTLHVKCVLGNFSRFIPETEIMERGKRFVVVLNNHNTRPLCSHCHSRCMASVILKDRNEDNGYLCSASCFMNSLD